MTGPRVVVGMSGGVDSSVAALLLKEEGYDVIGVTMQIWQSESSAAAERDGGCCGTLAAADAARVADVLDIPHYVMDFRPEFEEHVVRYFVDSYIRGRTPNPCVACNRFVKWEALLDRSLALGAEYIATGHYAGIVKLENGRYSVRNAVTAAKDQTYALYQLTQRQLSHTLMPVGGYTKPEIREIAEKAGLPVASKPDSQEICFIPDDDYGGFIDRYAPGRVPGPGSFVDSGGNILGTHRGITHYTVGQRKHLGLPMGKPVFVTGIDPEKNEVRIGSGDEIFGTELTCDEVNYMAVGEEAFRTGEIRARAKIRYTQRDAVPCTLRREGKLLRCVFDVPVRAITPGQAAVFYEGDHILCGGTIL